MIYAVVALETPYVKFGFTSDQDVQSRVNSMQTGCPHELQAVAFGPGDRALEAKIHWRLKKLGVHHRGEWFVRCKEAEKIIWEIRQSADRLNIAACPDPVASGAGRLGRVLDYARRIQNELTSSARNSSPQAAGTPEALQPHKSAA